MITLITGLPGACKTLFTLNFLKAIADKNPGRQIYYSGIRQLTLPWVNIGGYEKSEDGTTKEVIPDGAPVRGGLEWYKLPEGSIVVLDECQNYFRTRGQGQPVPRAVQEMETHRHRGFDLYLITQHPMLIDTNVRRLVERHFHCKRWFGLQRSTVHEFVGVKDQVEKNQNGSVRHEFKFPKKSYAWYKSAEIHTVKSRVPARFWFLVMAPLLLAALGYVGWSRMKGYATAEGAKQRIEGKGSPGTNSDIPGAARPVGGQQAKVMTVSEYVQNFKPRIPTLPHTAPAFDEVMKPTQAPTPVACVAMGSKCSCYTDQATLIGVEHSICMSIVEKGYFQYWAEKQANGMQRAVAPVSPQSPAVPGAPAAPAARPQVVMNFPARP